MNVSTRAPRLHVFGRAVLAGVLTMLLLVSGLAAGSPALHQWLHSDHASPTHVCLVSTLEQGHTHASACVSLVIPPAELIVPAVSSSVDCISIDFLLPCGRGPPCLA